jgi:hypothetical protein
MAAYSICRCQKKNFQSFAVICRKPHVASSIYLRATIFQNPEWTLWTHCITQHEVALHILHLNTQRELDFIKLTKGVQAETVHSYRKTWCRTRAWHHTTSGWPRDMQAVARIQ